MWHDSCLEICADLGLRSSWCGDGDGQCQCPEGWLRGGWGEGRSYATEPCGFAGAPTSSPMHERLLVIMRAGCFGVGACVLELVAHQVCPSAGQVEARFSYFWTACQRLSLRKTLIL